MQINLSKNYLLVAVFFIIFLYAFSFGPIVGMDVDKYGQMSPCPFSMATSICTMTFLEHLNLWQSMFTATSDNNIDMLVASGLIIFAVFLTLKYLEKDRGKELLAYKLYTHEHQKSFVSNKLIELFSRGILNPKIYALAAL